MTNKSKIDVTSDKRINPSHYIGKKGFESINFIEKYQWGFHIGNAFKYTLRAGKKDDERTDWMKCLWYLKRYNIYSSNTPAPTISSISEFSEIVDGFELNTNQQLVVLLILIGEMVLAEKAVELIVNSL